MQLKRGIGAEKKGELVQSKRGIGSVLMGNWCSFKRELVQLTKQRDWLSFNGELAHFKKRIGTV